MKKLLLVLLCVFSMQAYSQATANQAPDLVQCGNEVFNLTAQTPVILGNQTPNQFTVNYYLSLADANAATNPIASPTGYVSPQNQVIFARVTNTQDNTFATTSFTVRWRSIPNVTDIAGEIVGDCGFFVLPPPIPGSSYYADSAATIPLTSQFVTTSMMVYSYASNDYCSNLASFYVTINPAPIAISFPDVMACDSWTVPMIPPGQNIYTGPTGTGDVIPAGTVITTSMVLYVFAVSGTGGNCTNESSFNITISQTPILDQIADIVSCEPVVLPALSVGNYFTGPMGTGSVINAGDMITSTQTLYVFAQGGMPECSVQQVLHVTVGSSTFPTQAPLLGCDPDQDGFASFDLNSRVAGLLNNNPNLSVSFYETLIDAQAGVNPVQSPYFNIALNQTLYIRLAINGGECYSTGELPLHAGICGVVSGIVRFDSDNNGCNANDAPLENIQVIATTGNDFSYAYTNAQGEYAFTNVSEGQHTIYVGQNALGTVTPGYYPIEITGSNNVTVNFCIAPAVQVNDLQVYLWPTSTPRPGFAANYQLRIINHGNSVQTGSVSFTYDDGKLNFSSASQMPDTQSSGLLTFNFADMVGGSIRDHMISLMVEIPPTANSGDVVVSQAEVTSNLTDATPYNNIVSFGQVIVNSFDPNDKTVLQEAMLNDNTQDYLQYVVRFQNTGTAEAINVRITDELDSNLDWSTFRPIGASHDYTTQLDADGLATFTFNGINLPDSTANEPASHGYVAYEVKLKSGLTVNDDIYNTANIYFDFNAPIVTNTVMTDLVALLGVGNQDLSLFGMYPNPATQIVTIEMQNAFTMELFDIQGKKIMDSKGENQLSIDVSVLQKGMYFVKVVTDNGSEVKKLLVK